MPIKVNHKAFKPDATLRGWVLNTAQGEPYLTGRIYGDRTKRFEDGWPVRTSTVQFIDGDKATTQNTRYLLEEPANVRP